MTMESPRAPVSGCACAQISRVGDALIDTLRQREHGFRMGCREIATIIRPAGLDRDGPSLW